MSAIAVVLFLVHVACIVLQVLLGAVVLLGLIDGGLRQTWQDRAIYPTVLVLFGLTAYLLWSHA